MTGPRCRTPGCRPALAVIWPLFDELFRADAVAPGCREWRPTRWGCGPRWTAFLDAVFGTATLDRPGDAPLAAVAGQAGREGVHTEALEYVLAELQSVARAYPDATW